MKIHFHAVLSLFIGITIFGASACQRTNDSVQAARETDAPDAMSATDRDFVMRAEKDNIRERALGRLAEERSESKDVRDYGKMLAEDHNFALIKLVDLMMKNGIPQSTGLVAVKNEAVHMFNGLSGEEFDRLFISTMVRDHKKAIEAFQREADTGQNPAVRDYAMEVLPTLQKHLEHAEELQNKMGTTSDISR